MPSDRTDRPPAAASGSARPRFQLAGVVPALVVAVATVFVFAGCNTGSMNEARQSQQFDAAETPRLTAQQATRTAETFFSPTSTPAVPTPVPPRLDTLVITLGVGPDGAPSGSYLSIPVDAGTAYAAGRLSDVHAGQKVSATWTDAFGNIMGSFEVELAADAAAQWVSVPLQLGGTTGEHAVYLYGGGHQLGSLAFMVTGPGSGAQLLPELPANPQARATVAPRQSEQREESWDDNQQEGGDDWQQQEGGEWQQPNEGTWQQEQSQWEQQPQDQWNQQPQDQWNQQPQDQWNQQPQDQWNQPPVEGQSPSDWN